MRLSSSILFLGCWLTRQWQIDGGQYLKPSILVTPSPNVALGGNFYIQCRSPYNGATFDLFKGDPVVYVRSETSSSDTVDFFTSEAELENGGIYQCRYCLDRICSYLSDSLYINVTDSPKPKPSISVSPGEVIFLEGNANIHCKAEEQQEFEFTLHIENSSNTYESKKMGSGEVLFPIINAKESDGGIYRCSYCLKFMNTQACSDYSDVVHIKVTAPPKPSISVSPGEVIALEGNASIHCKTEEQQELEFTLHRENSSNTYESKRMGSGEVLFPIINAKESDGGAYRCSYCLKFKKTQACSNYSDEVHIKVTANTFPSMEITIRLAVAVLVLLSLVLIVAEFMCGRQG